MHYILFPDERFLGLTKLYAKCRNDTIDYECTTQRNPGYAYVLILSYTLSLCMIHSRLKTTNVKKKLQNHATEYCATRKHNIY